MVAEFTEIQKTTLKGKAPSLAVKHKCSQRYIRLIIKGEREINTPLAEAIFKDLQILLDFFTPKTQED
ncbi:MAG: hypothetical protein ABGW88_13875 [Leeuwenhoekiella sp.]|uniref:hypothetical protein n=1 Tax=Leeuwenhoekiella sp. TaxID=1977054 RepID=UPI003242EBEE